MRSLTVVSTALLFAFSPVAVAHAESPHGNFEMRIDGRYDFHTWIWALSSCTNRSPDCVHVQAIPQPVARAFPYKGDALLTNGSYRLSVDVPEGLRCGNVYYGPVIPTRDVYTWDAMSLSGTMASTFDVGCDGAPGGTFTYSFQLTMM